MYAGTCSVQWQRTNSSSPFASASSWRPRAPSPSSATSTSACSPWCRPWESASAWSSWAVTPQPRADPLLSPYRCVVLYYYLLVFSRAEREKSCTFKRRERVCVWFKNSHSNFSRYKFCSSGIFLTAYISSEIIKRHIMSRKGEREIMRCIQCRHLTVFTWFIMYFRASHRERCCTWCSSKFCTNIARACSSTSRSSSVSRLCLVCKC